MQRFGQIAGLLFFSVMMAACHRLQTTPPPAPAPTAATTPKARSTHPAQQRTSQPAQSAPIQPTPAQAAPPPAAAPDYRLGQALTPEELQAQNADIDRRLRHAREALASVGGRALTREQQSTVAHIRDFIAQCEEMRKTDVAAARSLASRADILASDLSSSVR